MDEAVATLVQMAEQNNVTAQALAARAGLDSDRLNNGGLSEVVRLLLTEGDDAEWIEGLIKSR